MKFFVSGLINVETNLRIRSFPVTYYPIDYPFFGINSTISGVGYNIATAAKTLGNEVVFASLIGKDHEGRRISHALDKNGTDKSYVFDTLDATPVSVILYEPAENGRRQIYCDLKDIQERTLDPEKVRDAICSADVCVLCNSNFNRALLPIAKADILFLSDENLPCPSRKFMAALKSEYNASIIVIGLGAAGAMLYERATDTVTEMSAAAIGGAVNTVGAGDALFTAFNHYYFHGCSAVESLKRAQVFAALKIRHDGGARGFSDESQVDEIYKNYKFTCRTE